MSWTVSTLAAALITNIGGESTDSRFLTEIKAWINEAYKALIRAHRWPWTFVTENIAVLASNDTYGLATTGMEVIGARLAGDEDTELIYMHPSKLIGIDLEAESKPQWFYITNWDSTTEKLQIVLKPIPSTTYTLQVFEHLRPANLDDDDIIPCPEEFIEIMRKMVKYKVLLDDRDYPAAKELKTEFLMDVEDAKRRLGNVGAERRVMAISDVPRTKSGHVQMDPNKFEGWNW